MYISNKSKTVSNKKVRDYFLLENGFHPFPGKSLPKQGPKLTVIQCWRDLRDYVELRVIFRTCRIITQPSM